MTRQPVKGYTRKSYKLKGKTVKPRGTKKYSRKKRPKYGKKLTVSKDFIRLYPITDEYGQKRGFKSK